jgi:hypothetical protein
MDVICPCNNCSEHLEFYESGAGETVSLTNLTSVPTSRGLLSACGNWSFPNQPAGVRFTGLKTQRMPVWRNGRRTGLKILGP